MENEREKAVKNVYLSEREILLLAYFHEHAERFDRDGHFLPENVCPLFEWSVQDWIKTCTYLQGFGLVSPWRELRSDPEHVPYYLTPIGENFMRELEMELLRKQRITSGEILDSKKVREFKKAGWDVLIQTAAAILARLITGA